MPGHVTLFNCCLCVVYVYNIWLLLYMYRRSSAQIYNISNTRTAYYSVTACCEQQLQLGPTIFFLNQSCIMVCVLRGNCCECQTTKHKLNLSRQAFCNAQESGQSESVCFNCVFLVGICSLSSTEWSSLWCVKAQCLKPWSWTEKSIIPCTGQSSCTSEMLGFLSFQHLKRLFLQSYDVFFLFFFFKVSVWEPESSTCILPVEAVLHTTGLISMFKNGSVENSSGI